MLEHEIEQQYFEQTQDSDALWRVQCLEEAVAQFGWAPTDAIPRRDQVTCFSSECTAAHPHCKSLYIILTKFVDILSTVYEQICGHIPQLDAYETSVST